MKHIKNFENYNYEFNIGDYVIAKNTTVSNKTLKNYVINNIGIIVKIDNISPDNIYYVVEYNILNNNIIDFMVIKNNKHKQQRESGTFPFHGYELILATTEEIEKQKIKDDANKYNL